MFQLKPISSSSIAGALAKAERYRLLNEPTEAESICRDILEAEPANQDALRSLVLALTDQIPHDSSAFGNAVAVCSRFVGRYDRAYYAGIAWERRAKAAHAGGRGARDTVYHWIEQALVLFEEAERVRPADNDDAILRWNTCVRYLRRHPELEPRVESVREAILSE